MVTGLVYTEVNPSADHRRERSRVKKSLATEARLIRRMRGTTPAKQKAYANKAGRSLLRSIHKMESDIVDLQNKVHEQEDNHIRSTKCLTEELMILRPLKENAVAIRRRYFATYRRSQDEMEDDDPLTIDSGNKSAHRGDVCLDVCLFKKRLIEYDDTFSTLYGLSWSDAEALLGYEQLVCAMNARASAITDSRLWWTPLRELAFRALISWIGDASTDELKKFKEGIEKDTYPQRLFQSMGCAP